MRRLFRGLNVFAVMALFCLFFASCTNRVGGPAGGGQTGNVLRVGMECAYAPFNWTQLDDKNGAVRLSDGTYAGGYDVEIAKKLAESLGMELEVVKAEWEGLPPSLTSGKIDAIIAGMTDTPERRETIDFTDAYYKSDLVLVVRSNGSYTEAKTLSDLSGARVTGQLGTLLYDLIDQIPGVVKEPAMKDFATIITALSSGKLDAYVAERPSALAAIEANPGFTFISFERGEGFDYSDGDVSVSIGVRQGDTELKEGINRALAELTDANRIELMQKAVANQPLFAEE